MNKGGTQTNEQKDQEIDDDAQGLTHERHDDTDRLYASGKEGGRGLASDEDCVDAAIQRLEECTKKRTERLITAACNSNDKVKLNRKATKTRKQKKEEKTVRILQATN